MVGVCCYVTGVCCFVILAAQNLLALLVVWHKHGQLTIPLLPSLRQVQEPANLEEQAWTNWGLQAVFLWRVFLFCVLACSSFIFFLSFKKKCAVPRGGYRLTKTMTKKLTATPHKACVLWLLCVGSSLSRACAGDGLPGFNRTV